MSDLIVERLLKGENTETFNVSMIYQYELPSDHKPCLRRKPQFLRGWPSHYLYHITHSTLETMGIKAPGRGILGHRFAYFKPALGGGVCACALRLLRERGGSNSALSL